MSGSQILGAVVSLISAIGVITSMGFIGWQMRQSTHQRRISNALAGTSNLRATLEHLHSVERIFIEKPHLRPYFMDAKPRPEDDDTRHQVETVAGMLASVLEIGLATNEQIQETGSKGNWLDFSVHMLTVSPVLAESVTNNPQWHPRLAVLAQLRIAAGPTGVTLQRG